MVLVVIILVMVMVLMISSMSSMMTGMAIDYFDNDDGGSFDYDGCY